MKVHVNLEKVNNYSEYVNSNFDKSIDIMGYLRKDPEDFTGWVNWPCEISDEFLTSLENTAEDIKSKCNTLVVIGIGGSYLGTAAVIDALGGSKAGCPEVVFAGNNLSGNYHAKFKKIIDDNEVCLCVVSKSGGTMESRIAFSLLKAMMYDKYGEEETAKRIVAITDPVKGILRQETNEKGYASFEIPGNIGGRYSAFTAGIMFPLAVAGVDIRAFVQGAKDAACDDEFWKNEGVKYALTRFGLNESGKDIEVFEYYDPSLRLIGEWCKQLFGESEGKEGKGLFPASLTLSTDLHSMGQYLQDGKQVFFETVINVLNWDKDVVVPEGDSLAGMSLNEINQNARKGVIEAHSKVGVPIIQIEVEDIKEYCLGQLLYFFMMTAAITGKLMEIDPFTQDGVEQYKAEIRTLLGK